MRSPASGNGETVGRVADGESTVPYGTLSGLAAREFVGTTRKLTPRKAALS